MALDTPTKRYSAVHIGCPWRSSVPIPDGEVTQGDRRTLALLYFGVETAIASITAACTVVLGALTVAAAGCLGRVPTRFDLGGGGRRPWLRPSSGPARTWLRPPSLAAFFKRDCE